MSERQGLVERVDKEFARTVRQRVDGENPCPDCVDGVRVDWHGDILGVFRDETLEVLEMDRVLLETERDHQRVGIAARVHLDNEQDRHEDRSREGKGHRKAKERE